MRLHGENSPNLLMSTLSMVHSDIPLAGKRRCAKYWKAARRENGSQCRGFVSLRLNRLLRDFSWNSQAPSSYLSNDLNSSRLTRLSLS